MGTIWPVWALWAAGAVLDSRITRVATPDSNISTLVVVENATASVQQRGIILGSNFYCWREFHEPDRVDAAHVRLRPPAAR
ncbi:unnamed protein product, partial [Iphiclides podalirius]